MEWKTHTTDKGYIIFLPIDVNEFELIDISDMGSPFKKFLDPKTNKIHDCKKYYRMYRMNLENGKE